MKVSFLTLHMFNLGIVDKEERIMKFQEGDTIVDQGIIYSVEKDEEGEGGGALGRAPDDLREVHHQDGAGAARR